MAEIDADNVDLCHRTRRAAETGARPRPAAEGRTRRAAEGPAAKAGTGSRGANPAAKAGTGPPTT